MTQELDSYWYNHQIEIVNKRNAALEAALTAAEQKAKELEEALRIVEWIMVGGRVQCPACFFTQVDGHAVLCRIDEALRPTPEKARIRALQEAMYKECRGRAALAQPRTGSHEDDFSVSEDDKRQMEFSKRQRELGNLRPSAEPRTEGESNG